ncbi:hypothetical protein D3C72_1881550 [compost metagenome]
MTAARPCSILNGATGAAPPALAATILTASTFTAGATGSIHAGAAAADAWTIDHNKDLRNTVNGIP